MPAGPRGETFSNGMTYRPEIDGLRAIAILAVVAYPYGAICGVPTFRIPVPECLSRRSAAECAVSTKDHEASLAPIIASLGQPARGK